MIGFNDYILQNTIWGRHIWTYYPYLIAEKTKAELEIESKIPLSQSREYFYYTRMSITVSQSD